MKANNLRNTISAINFKKFSALLLSSVIIISMLSMFSLPEVQAATTTFGNTNVGNTWNTLYGTKDAARYQLSQQGTIQSISVYFANSGFNAKAAIYSDSGGSANQLIAQSSSQWVSSPGWQTFAVPQTSLSSGYYWLSTSADNYGASGVMSMTGSSNSHIWVGSIFASDFSGSFGTPRNSDKGIPSIYATYTPTSTTTFGNTNVGNTWDTLYGTKNAARYQLSQQGTIQSISVYFANSGFNAKAAIYSDSGGSANQLIAQSSSQWVSSPGWQTFAVPQTSLSSGYYWLTYSADNYGATGVKSMTGSSNSHIWVGSTFASDFSSWFGTPRNSDKGIPSIYATFTQTTSETQPAQSFNLAPIPNGWCTATNGMWLAAGGVGNNVLDYNVQYYGAPTIRQDPVWSTNNYGREVNGPYINIKPGDHITFSCWIKTSASSFGDKDPYSGARIGIDFYGPSGSGVITGTASPDGAPVWNPYSGWASSTELNYVHWGTSTWTKIVMSFTVASSYPASPGYAGNQNNFYVGQWATPAGIIPWMQVWSSTYGANDGGSAWFANAELTIN